MTLVPRALTIRLRRFPRLFGLPPRELTDLALAQCYLGVARWRRLTRREGEFVSLESATEAVGPPGIVDDGAADSVTAEALASAVERAATYGILKPTCLERAVALQKLLRRRGVDGGRVRVGVRWEGGEFYAHAWVELNGVILADSPARVGAFTSIAEAGVPER